MKDELKGEMTLIISAFFFAVTAIFVKFASSSFDGFFMVFVRSFIGLIFSALLIVFLKQSFKVYDKKTLLFRGLSGIIAILFYWTSIQMTGPGRATLLNTTYPIFVAIYGYLFFGEKVKKKSIFAIAVAFLGTTLVFYDGSSYNLIGDILGLMSGMFAGFAVHFIKRSRDENNPMIVYMALCIFGILVSFFSVGQAASFTVVSFWFVFVAAIMSFFAQIFMTYGFKHVTSTKGSIITFVKIPMTLFFSFLIFGEEMNFRFIFGTVLILIGLIIERRKAKSTI